MARHPHVLGQIICEALGLPAQEVTELSFNWTPGEIGFITVKMFVRDAQGEKMAEVFKRYELVEREGRL